MAERQIAEFNIPGIMNKRDLHWVILHPSGVWVGLTDYNQEITGHTDNAKDFPILGEYIHYGGNAYYVIGEANRLGFITVKMSPKDN